MAKLVWDKPNERFFEAGVDKGVFYSENGTGYAWNGLVSINETSSDPNFEGKYVDGQKYTIQRSETDYEAELTAFTYPDEFEEYDGLVEVLTNQGRKSFGLSYRTFIGSATQEGFQHYKIHLVYNALAFPSDKSFKTIDANVDLEPFSWNLFTRPVVFEGYKPTAHLIVDSRYAYSTTLEELENTLYGTEDTQPHLPSPEELFDIFERNAILRIINHGDGTWTAIGPDEAVRMIDSTTFEISWPSVVYIDEETYTVKSL